MNLAQFNDKYNIDNGWIGPYQMDDGRLKVSKYYKKSTQPKAYWHHEYFTIYKCKYCKRNALSTARLYNSVDGTVSTPATCSRYSNCFSKHAAIQISKNNVVTNRDNPGIDTSGYHYWRAQTLDKDGNKISTGDGNKRTHMYLHRVVVEEDIGRKLKSDEIVHHIDCDKLNNDLDNLWICDDKGHGIAHASTDDLLPTLMHKLDTVKAVKFNRKTGRYYIVYKSKDKEI
jgi:hypothetical protein